MEGLFTIENIAKLAGLAVVAFWFLCRIAAQSDTIAAAMWAATHEHRD